MALNVNKFIGVRADHNQSEHPDSVHYVPKLICAFYLEIWSKFQVLFLSWLAIKTFSQHSASFVYVRLSWNTKTASFLFSDFRENTLNKKLLFVCVLCPVTIMWQDTRVRKSLKTYFRKAKLNANIPFCHLS